MMERDEWVFVKTLSADRARRFFGVSEDCPVEEVPGTLDEADGRRLFKVKASRVPDPLLFQDPREQYGKCHNKADR